MRKATWFSVLSIASFAMLTIALSWSSTSRIEAEHERRAIAASPLAASPPDAHATVGSKPARKESGIL